jgi:hypothetical protein
MNVAPRNGTHSITYGRRAATQAAEKPSAFTMTQRENQAIEIKSARHPELRPGWQSKRC